MPNIDSRTEILLGSEVLTEIKNKHVLVGGVGGVGGYVAETLARAGIGEITLLDMDKITKSNINRQIIALNSTVGMNKTEIMKSRINDINPNIKVNIITNFMSVDSAKTILSSYQFDYIADCIDTIACKAQLVFEAQKKGIKIISAMGAGNRIDATKATVTTLNKTQNCRLARGIRKKLRELGADLKYPVVFSDEDNRSPYVKEIVNSNYIERATNGTISYMPAIFGLLLAGEIIKYFILEAEKENT